MHVIDGLSNDEAGELLVKDDLSDQNNGRYGGNFGAQAVTGRDEHARRVNLIEQDGHRKRRNRAANVNGLVGNTIDGAIEPSETKTGELSDGYSQRLLPSVGGDKVSRMPVLN